MTNDWEKIDEKIVHDGYRKVLQKTFKMPDGQIVDYEVVKMDDCVCVMPLTKDKKVIIAKQFRVGPEKVLAELPGGGVSKGEDPEKAIARELLEETGYRGELIYLGKSYDSAYTPLVRSHFIALNCKKNAEPYNDPNEPIEVVLVTLDEFMKQLHRGELTDSETAYRALEYLNTNKDTDL